MKTDPTRTAAGTPLDAAGRAIQRQAAEWLALREGRGFIVSEQADFAEWLARDPRHATIFGQVESSWTALDRLAAYPHSADRPADPDLFAPRREQTVFARWRLPLGLAAGILIAISGLWWFKPSAPLSSEPSVADAAALRFLRLPDGSQAEMKPGSRLVERFSTGERRVQLVQGEVHFSVMKNAGRPFVVEVNGVMVRAVGTAFNVRLAATNVEVLVTEGTVRVEPPAPISLPSAGPSPVEIAAVLTVGQRTVVPTEPKARAAPPLVETLAPADIDRALAWQGSRFTFESTPLADVVARFNRNAAAEQGAPHLTVGDASLGALRISGRIRSDKIDSFVEVLESSFGVVAERRAGGEIVLRRAAAP